MNKATLFTKGLFYENPLLVLAMGLCPALAITTTAKLGFALGMATLVILLVSNFLMSLLRKTISDKMEMAATVVIISGVTSVVQLLIKGFFPLTEISLGIFLPLIAVNCIILDSMGFFARQHNIGETLINAFGIGMGYLWALVLLGAIRELLGEGTFWGKEIFDNTLSSTSVFMLLPGGLFILGTLMAFLNWILRKAKNRRARV